MADTSNPSEIAREALRRLAVSRVPPTPDNYRAYYHEISNTPVDDGFPEKPLKAIAAALPRHTPEAARRAHDFERAVTSNQWPQVRLAILALSHAPADPKPGWAALIRDLIFHLGQHHAGLTPARKREALEHVLEASATHPEMLHKRLQGLVRGWAAAPSAAMAGSGEEREREPATSSAADGVPVLGKLLIALLHRTIPAFLNRSEERRVGKECRS